MEQCHLKLSYTPEQIINNKEHIFNLTLNNGTIVVNNLEDFIEPVIYNKLKTLGRLHCQIFKKEPNKHRNSIHIDSPDGVNGRHPCLNVIIKG